MGIKSWIQRQLGIELLDSRTSRLEELEMFSLQDVVDRLGESMVILANDGQTLENVDVIIPPDKNGILVLGSHTTVRGGFFRPPKTKTTVEIIEDENMFYRGLQGSTNSLET